jgi:hypothetical protein
MTLLRIDHWMEGLQLRTPAFAVGLPLFAGVHCITQTSRVSGLRGQLHETVPDQNREDPDLDLAEDQLALKPGREAGEKA